MADLDVILEGMLVVLLAVTLVHAVRLERALKVLRQERATLGDAIAGFDDSSRQAEAGFSLLQGTATEAAQALAHRIEQAQALKDDLQFLALRGEAAADRLDGLVRTARTVQVSPPATVADPQPKVRSQAERDLLLALRGNQ